MSIQFKRSTISGVLPTTTNMYQGELAINLPDKRLYTLDNNNQIINIGFSKDEANSTYLSLQGGSLTGPLELYASTPFIDFHYNNITSDYSSRIIASSSNTLSLISTNVVTSGNLSVTSGLSASSLTITNNAAITGQLTVANIVRGTSFKANSGAPTSIDSSNVGFTFDSNGDTGVFYEDPSTSTYGGVLVLRNDGSVCLRLVSGLVTCMPQLRAAEGLYTGDSSTSSTVKLSNDGTIELYGSQTPFIDFHYQNSQADYTSRIIATGSNTLQIVSTNISLSGAVTANSLVSTNNLSVGGSITSSGKVILNGDGDNAIQMTGDSSGRITFNDAKDPDNGIYNYTLMMDNGNITFNYSTSSNLYDVGTAKHVFNYLGGYTASGSIIAESNIEAHNDLHVTNNSYIGGVVYASSTIKTPSSIYSGDASNSNSSLLNRGSIELYGTTPYIDFHHNNNSADYTSRIITTDDGLYLTSRIRCEHGSSPYYGNEIVTKDYVDNKASTAASAGLRAITPVNVYWSDDAGNGVQTTGVAQWMFGNRAPSFVMYSLRAWSSGYTDLAEAYIAYGNAADWNKFVLAASSDDTDHAGNARIAGATTCLIPYSYNQQFFFSFKNQGGGALYPSVRIDVIGYQL